MTTESFRILLADDDATVRLLMQAALEKAGFDVTVACDGVEAIRLFEATPADMVMLDVEMPGMDGYAVCAYLREKIGDELPIMMVTGMDDMQSINRSFETGATDFIAKPINWNLIAYRISKEKALVHQIINQSARHLSAPSRTWPTLPPK